MTHFFSYVVLMKYIHIIISLKVIILRDQPSNFKQRDKTLKN